MRAHMKDDYLNPLLLDLENEKMTAKIQEQDDNIKQFLDQIEEKAKQNPNSQLIANI
jgi:hypothetical protein